MRLAIFLLFIFFPLGFAIAEDKPKIAGEKIFGPSKVIQLHLTFEDKAFQSLNPTGPPRFGPPGFAPPKKIADDSHVNTFGVELPWSKANLQFEGDTFKDVGVRYKGNYTFMATSQSLKKSMKIDLNRHVDGQKLDGLTMLNLNCGVSDPTMTREAFSFAFFQDVGLPAPRTAFAEIRLTIPTKYSNECVGVYTLVEQVNKGFLKRHFKNGTGMLLKPEGLQGGIAYLGASWKAYEEKYHPENKPTNEEKNRLIAFAKLIDQGSDTDFEKEIHQFIEVNELLKFIAANMLLSNLDSYLGFGHNFYLYLNPTTNRFSFIPWDLDLSLAAWPAVGTPEQLVDLSIEHPHAGKNKLLDRLLANKQFHEQYSKIVREMYTNHFTKAKLVERIDAMEAALKSPKLKEARSVANRKENKNFGFGGPFAGGQFGQSLPPRKFIDKRIESIDSQLAGKTKGFEPKPFGFGPPGGGFGPPRR